MISEAKIHPKAKNQSELTESTPLLRQELPKEARAGQSIVVSNGNVEVRDLRRNSLLFVDRRASFGGCITDIDIHELEELLSQDELEPSDATYWKLMSNNRPYSLYILSYFCARAGEWFTYVAMISAIRYISPNSNTAVAGLVAIRTVPNIIFASIGGVLADTTDRRITMISLDLVGMLVVLLYIPVYHLKSLSMLYFVAFIQATVASIYDPIRRAIVPLLVTQEDYLQKATAMSGIAYSLMAAFGASLGGIAASAY
jgi:Na+/melibiose symporter-like transporter